MRPAVRINSAVVCNPISGGGGGVPRGAAPVVATRIEVVLGVSRLIASPRKVPRA